MPFENLVNLFVRQEVRMTFDPKKTLRGFMLPLSARSRHPLAEAQARAVEAIAQARGQPSILPARAPGVGMNFLTRPGKFSFV
jgi:hypothetical protein